MNSAVKRTNVIKLRVSDDELAQLQSLCTRSELARWIRETCLLQQPVQKKVQPLQQQSSELVRQVAAAGNNLNQIARHVHQYGAADESIKILAALRSIENFLEVLVASQNSR